MRKTILISLLITILLTSVPPTEAQQQAKMPKVGFLATGTSSVRGGGHELLRRELSELGYVQGKNIAFEYRYGNSQLDRLPALADELVRLKVDILVASATPATLAAKNAARGVPIVFVGVGDPVSSGLVDSLARPGGNITGLTNISAVLAGKRLELLKRNRSQTLPRCGAVESTESRSLHNGKKANCRARELGLQLFSMEVSSADKYEEAFKKAIKAGSTGLAVTQQTRSNRKQITDLATKNRLPAIYPGAAFVDSGGLMSYGPDEIEPYKRAASMVDKILKGAKPADLAVEQPTKFALQINLKTANTLGLTIPPVVMMRAEKVIK